MLDQILGVASDYEKTKLEERRLREQEAAERQRSLLNDLLGMNSGSSSGKPFLPTTPKGWAITIAISILTLWMLWALVTRRK